MSGARGNVRTVAPGSGAGFAVAGGACIIDGAEVEKPELLAMDGMAMAAEARRGGGDEARKLEDDIGEVDGAA
jgi:hypothetical protein